MRQTGFMKRIGACLTVLVAAGACGIDKRPGAVEAIRGWKRPQPGAPVATLEGTWRSACRPGDGSTHQGVAEDVIFSKPQYSRITRFYHDAGCASLSRETLESGTYSVTQVRGNCSLETAYYDGNGSLRSSRVSCEISPRQLRLRGAGPDDGWLPFDRL